MKIRVEKLTNAQQETLGIMRWPVWEKETSDFSWHYDEQEMCYFLEGEVAVELPSGEVVVIGVGDFVTFPAGLSCTWHVKKKVKKHYRFG